MEIVKFNHKHKKQVDDFIRLPFSIYRDIPQWVPPLQMDERRRFNPKQFPFYQHSEAAFFIAYQPSDPVAIGRLAVLDNRRYNEFNKTKTAFFYLFECEDNKEAATALFDAGFDWARSRGLDSVLGPKGFTPLDGFGLLTKGFEHRPAFGLPYNPAFYVDLIDDQGFVKESETVSGYLSKEVEFPPRIHHLADRLAQRRGLRILRCNTRADLRAVIPYLKELYNNSLEGTQGTVPLTDDEVSSMANQLIWLADPKLVKLVMKVANPGLGKDKAVGFLLAYPDVSAALQKTKGNLFPFGWLTLLRELRRTDWININGAGLLPEYRGSGGTAILYSEMFKSIKENARYQHADVVQIDVENENMQRELENFGIQFYKLHRTYKKSL
jgi:hypothetical protein